ncbi:MULTISPECIES: helix-turn-helix transcriptional regulator [Vagococcus]|uniref:HTH cro/C1-type domain-containing protein n=1 Tax=Vagococcus fluvialis bH819 TaxID=1255619 RepID=A0A1X6WQL0_9ENTE|nr:MULTISPECIES: helix-turn-helix transcriptional regulator [Vagococcus]SLM86557.1 hypothetical protein FM121_10720 [Vagococcus fluvialis bH819]HCM90764.1 XRE family transcriptional regulator [Vagococcus sp.]
MKSTVSFNLKKFRKKNNMTQQEMAQALFVTPQAVSKWEREESLPDISLVPQIARLFNISISDLWLEEAPLNTQSSFDQLNHLSHSLIDDDMVESLIIELDQMSHVSELTTSFDFFMILNDQQKEQVVTAILKVPHSDDMVEDFYHYLSAHQKEKMIIELLDKKRYLALEGLIPMMSRVIRTRVMEATINDHAYDFLEELFPFLNFSHKELLIGSVKNKKLSYGVLENYVTFFTESQRQELLLYEED